MSTLFAATHARTAALVLMGTFPREMQAPDYPWGVSEEIPPAPRPPRGGRLGSSGDERLARPRRPGHPERPGGAALVHVVRATRRQPGATKALRLMNVEIDIRACLPTISVPTLVLHRAQGKLARRVSLHGRAIQAATLVELPGNTSWRAIGRCSTKSDADGCSGGVGPDRVLATLLFTEIVGSAMKAAELGERRVARLARQASSPRARAARSFRGREVDMAGDGVFAAFDGPARGPVRLGDRRRAQGAGLTRAGRRARAR